MLASTGFWPQDLIGWATVVAALAATASVGVLIKAGLAALQQIRETAKSRSAALFSEISRRWDEPAMVESRHRANSFSPERLLRRVQWLEGEEAFDEQQVLYRMPNFFEDMAILQSDGDIPFAMIQRSLGGTLVAQWDHWAPAVSYLRGDQRYDLVYENWERLAAAMKIAVERAEAEAS